MIFLISPTLFRINTGLTLPHLCVPVPNKDLDLYRHMLWYLFNCSAQLTLMTLMMRKMILRIPLNKRYKQIKSLLTIK